MKRIRAAASPHVIFRWRLPGVREGSLCVGRRLPALPLPTLPLQHRAAFSCGPLRSRSPLSARPVLPRRAIMDKVKGGKGAKPRATSPPPPPPPQQSQGVRNGARADEGAVHKGTLAPEQEAAARRAFPDLYSFLDQLGDDTSMRQALAQQHAKEEQKSRTFTQFLDDDDDEERWDDSVQFDSSLAEVREPELNVSDEERETMSQLNDILRRVQSQDDEEDDPTVLLFRKLDKENELMRIQHEHVQNMPEYIGYNEEFQEQQARIRKAWSEDPRSVTADHVQELYRKLEEKRQELWDKYTTQAAERFVVENYEQLVLQALRGDEDDDEDQEDQANPIALRPPFMKLTDRHQK